MGELQGLRHEIRDIVGEKVYNGLSGRSGLSIAEQREQFESVAPRVGERAAELRARADELEAKQGEVQAIVDRALAVLAEREANQPSEADESQAAAFVSDGDDGWSEDDEDFDEEDYDDDPFDEEDDDEAPF